MRVLKLIFALVVVALATSFLYENPWILSSKYSIQYYGLENPVSITLPVLLIVCMLIAVIVTAVLMALDNVKLRRLLRKKGKEAKLLEQELGELRNRPVWENPAESEISKTSNTSELIPPNNE